MSPRRMIVSLSAAILTVAAYAVAMPAARAAMPTSLLLPQSTAFAILGHSCGGIQEQAFATGFAKSGYPKGDVYLRTRCGGSGRGAPSTTYSAWVAVTWDFTGGVKKSVTLAAAPANVSATFTATDSRGDVLANQLTAVNVLPPNCVPADTTYCTYRTYLTVAAPGQPTGVTVTQSADSLQVAWTPSVTGGPPSANTVTAVPADGTATLTVTAAATATSAVLMSAAPATSYSITVTGSNGSGTGAASTPVVFETQPATTPPSAPAAVTVSWQSGGLVLHASWPAANPGNSPIDDYQAEISRSDPAGPPYDIDTGTALSVNPTTFDPNLDWSVRVRAHNAAGWGQWSPSTVLPAF